MSEQTNIEWCDSTFNPWMGCTKVSPACDHCYAERDTKRFGRVQWGAGQPRLRTAPANWKKPGQWNREDFGECTKCGWRAGGKEWRQGCPTHGFMDCLRPARRRVFTASLADWLDGESPIPWRVDLLDLIRLTPNLDWLLLTKRIGNWRRSMENARSIANGDCRADLVAWLDAWLAGNPPVNVWIGTTVINQEEADRDVPKLLKVPAHVRFLSIEPMLGPISLDISRWGSCFHAEQSGNDQNANHAECASHLDWVICGGESGPHARPMHIDWVRSLRDECAAAGVSFLFKQWGEWAPAEPTAELRSRASMPGQNADVWAWPDGTRDGWRTGVMSKRIGKSAAGRMLDGVEHSGYPTVTA